MRRAKDNRHVPKRYYRPEQTTCSYCGCSLKRAYQLWRKHIVFLHGREWVVNWGYRCSNPDCDEQHRVYASQTARGITIRGSSFALEVIVQIGYWRFWKRWTVAQIHDVLTQERQLPISEREVLYLIGIFLVLLRSPYHLRLEEHAAYFRRHGLFLSGDYSQMLQARLLREAPLWGAGRPRGRGRGVLLVNFKCVQTWRLALDASSLSK